jgi:hypothetical protein
VLAPSAVIEAADPPLPVRSERVDKVEATADDPSRIDLGLEHG